MTARGIFAALTADCTVIDASVAVKWLVPERGSDEVRAVLNSGVPLIAPSQIQIEVAGAMLRRFREDRLELADARRACAEWVTLLRDGAVAMVDNDMLLESAIDIAFELRHALPDCLYVALATQTNGALLTCDRKLHERGQSRCRVKLLDADG